MAEDVKKFYIYGLLHDDEIFYVGQTQKTPMDRLYGHVAQSELRFRQGKKLNRLEKYLLEMDEYPSIEVIYEFNGYQWQADEIEKLYISGLINYFDLKNTNHTKYPTKICGMSEAKILMSLAVNQGKYRNLLVERAALRMHYPYKRRLIEDKV